jgi:hypothetical protein
MSFPKKAAQTLHVTATIHYILERAFRNPLPRKTPARHLNLKSGAVRHAEIPLVILRFF